MANPRQRRKGKSSTYKAISHSKRAKLLKKKMPAICGPKALQDAWDPSKTVCQNYLALGLRQVLNPVSSGGSEVNLNQSRSTASCSAADHARSSAFEEPAVTPALPKGFGRIIRDPSGNVVRVELPTDEGTAHAPKQDPVIDAPVVTPESELRIWAHDHSEKRQGAGSGDTIIQGQLPIRARPCSTGFVDDIRFEVLPKDLEQIAASAVVRDRHTSLGERCYLERLVKKHGFNLDKMARDRGLNPGQRTANELKRAITKAGGFEALCEGTDMRVTG